MKKTDDKKAPSVLAITNRPVYFHTGIYQEMAKSRTYTTLVCYLDRHGLDAGWDKTFGATIIFDFPMLEGYRYRFLKNFGWDRSASHMFSRINPGIIRQVFKHDIIFFLATSTMSHWLALFTGIITRKKMIWRGEATLPEHPGWRWRIKRPLIRFFLKHCHALMYSCAGNREYIESFHLDKPLYPILCAVDNDYYQDEYKRLSGQRNTLRRKWQIPRQAVVILFPARLVERKNPGLLLDALADLKAAERNAFCLLFVGNGALAPTLRQTCREKGIPAVFTGFQTPGSLAGFYAQADIYINIAWEDYSPKAVNEAMNFELPVILSSKIGTARDLVPEGKNGFLIDPADKQALIRALRKLLSPALRRRMGKESGKIIKNFNFRDNARNIEKAVKDLQGG